MKFQNKDKIQKALKIKKLLLQQEAKIIFFLLWWLCFSIGMQKSWGFKNNNLLDGKEITQIIGGVTEGS